MKKLDKLFSVFHTLRCRCALRRLGIKFSNPLSSFPSGAVLDVEEDVSLGAVEFGFRHLSIGAHSYMRSGGELMNISHIGRFCSIANGVLLGHNKGHPLNGVTTHPFAFDDYPSARTGGVPARIGHDVWIGRDAVIFEGVSIGTGAAVGMRAVVTKNVPSYAVVAGVPARVVKYRFSLTLIHALIASRWWQYAPTELRDLPFNNPEEFLLALSGSKLPKKLYDCLHLSRTGYNVAHPMEWKE